jgi:hypothetical protein
MQIPESPSPLFKLVRVTECPVSDVKRNLITMKAALEKGGFKRTKAYKLIKDGKIAAYKMGHQTMVDADSIVAYHASLPRIEPGSVTR